ncbi:MAG: hypothetical protein KJ732_00645, partial [Candidatus Margulisbacteria bacterium]|nr:hypothetical protein [Candidatus Margulisiibacteriota bacterium]
MVFAAKKPYGVVDRYSDEMVSVRYFPNHKDKETDHDYSILDAANEAASLTEATNATCDGTPSSPDPIRLVAKKSLIPKKARTRPII